MKFPPFNLHSLCPKCNHKVIRSKFCPGNSWITTSKRCEIKDEHLHRVCDECGFWWIELCADVES